MSIIGREEKLDFDEFPEITLLEGLSFGMKVNEEEIRRSISPEEDSGLRQPERRIKAKQLQYNGIHPSSSGEIGLRIFSSFTFMPNESPPNNVISGDSSKRSFSSRHMMDIIKLELILVNVSRLHYVKKTSLTDNVFA
ncbi:unnamed protein product [Protopolystoma xenopodis]|uniref:Uncharacterized protein n=1 Tax=Protopolystoma xenopodis TaxID=117903 RepID=A0A3S4ZWF1_9PLAT|nr:unnamed protein product [Protopolystoma xenopodis]